MVVGHAPHADLRRAPGSLSPAAERKQNQEGLAFMQVDTVHATPTVKRRTRHRRAVVLLCGLALVGTSTLVARPAYASANPAPVNLGAAGNYAILASSGISTTGVTAITGDMGISPAGDTAITG